MFNSLMLSRWIPAVLLPVVACIGLPAAVPPAGRDLRLDYTSAIDGTDQPYRIYVPTSYDGTRPAALVIAMHGTGGNENGLFEDKRLPPNEVKRVAEKHGVLMACPRGRLTTEYRGLGENDVFCVIEDVRKRYRVDPDRIYLTGQSMGGTGAAYLALRHPDMFAAIAPLAPAYSFPWLVANLQHVPSWWIQGAKDAGFYLQGVDIGMERMRQLGVPAKRDLIPNEEHPAGVQRIDAVVGWLLQHKRVPHPRDYVFEIDTPLHGRAYWTQADQLKVPGKMALVRARAADRNRAELELQNVASVAFFPDPEVFDLASPLEVVVNRQKIFTGTVSAQQQLRLVDAGSTWKTSLEPRSVPALTAYRTHPVAMAPQALENSGTESLLANWITDAMRHATGADIALYNRAADRGLGIPAGTVDIVDLIQCSRPFDQYLVTAELTGSELLEILDANVPQLAGKDLSAVLGPDPADRNSSPAIPPDRQKANRLVQVSGMKYSFDMALPAGRRIVSSSLQPERRYTVVMEGQVVQRQTMLLAGRFGKLEYKTTGIAFTLALYGHACTTGKIEARIEGRVREGTGS